MKRLLALLPLFACAACHDAARDAEAQYNIVSKSGTLDEQCAAATRARDAYLAKQDADDYSRWGLTASIDCRLAQTSGGFMPADPKKRVAVEQQTADAELNASADALKAFDAADKHAAAADEDASHPPDDAYPANDAGE